MEIKFENVGYKSYLSYANFLIPTSITGITGKNKEYIIKMLNGNIYPMVGEVFIGNKVLNEENKKEFSKLVGIVEKGVEDSFLDCSVMHHIANVLDKSNYHNNNITARIKDALKMVGLDESYLTRKIRALSTGELKLMMMGTVLITNPKILVLEDPTVGLDFNNKRKVLKMIRLLKEKYHKTILIVSDDSDFLYQYTDYVLFTNDCNRVRLYKTDEVFLNVDLLLDNQVEIPKLVKFTYKANMKGAKLHYHKDIRDLIKDIYKHV